MSNNNYIYCDSCVFIAYFNEEPGRVEILEQLFEEVHKDKERFLVTSAFSIVEVAYVGHERTRVGGGQKARLKQDTEDRLDNFWSDNSLIEMIDFQEVLARDARKLIREAAKLGYVLKAPDALHLVSAQFVGAAEFFTYDDLSKYSGMTGLTICEPYIIQPRLPNMN